MLQSGHTYAIINKKSGTAFDLSDTDHTSIVGYDFHGGDNQKWDLLQQDNGLSMIRSIGTGKFLGVAGGLEDGVRAIGSDFPTLWGIRPDEEDPSHHRIYVPDSHLNADMSGNGNPTPGTPVELRGPWNGANKIWRFQPA